MKYRAKLRQDQERPSGCSCSEDALRAYKFSIWCNACPMYREWKLFDGVETDERIGDIGDTPPQ